MGTLAALDYTLWVAGFDFTGHINELGLEISWDDKDNTPFGSTAMKRQGTLENDEGTAKGFWQSEDTADPDAVDLEAFTGLGSTTQPVTMGADSAEGSVAYLWQARKFKYQMFGDIGDVAPFELDLLGSAGNSQPGAVRGQVAKAKGDVSATGALGSALNLGAVSSSQHVYAVLHVFETPGTTITVDVESDSAQAFSSAASVGTIGPITAAGGTWMTRVAGPVTDTWFRLNVTGITGTFKVAGAIAVQ